MYMHGIVIITCIDYERNKIFILLRSLAQNKALGVFPSEPLRSPLATALRARLRAGAQSQQNTGCCFVGLSDPETSFPDDANQA